MKATDKLIAAIDKKLERFDPIWQAEHGVGGQRSRYYDKTGVSKWREWRGVKDTFYDYTQWLNNLVSMVQMVASAPIPCLKGFWEYRWMGSYLGTFMFIDRLFEGFRGYELRTAHANMHAIVQSLTKRIALVLANDKRLGGGPRSDDFIPFDEVLPPLFMTGFKGLIPFPLQTLPEFIICDVDQHIEPYYIDVAESFGLPADVCSRCAAETGVAIDDAFPIIGKAFVTTNMPCNASECTSMIQRRRVNLPDFPVTMAMIHNEPGAHPYSTQVLKDTIAFIEKEYGVKYDWDELFKYAKLMNEQNTIELEKWDYFKTPTPPSAASPRRSTVCTPGLPSTAPTRTSIRSTARSSRSCARRMRRSISPSAAKLATVPSCGAPPRSIILTSRPGHRTAGASTSS